MNADQVFQVFELIDGLQAYYAAEILLGLGVLLILVDYFFPTDAPAHFGYFCIALATFFIAYRASWAPVWCVAVFVAAWILLGLLHRFFFRNFLENAPDMKAGDKKVEA